MHRWYRFTCIVTSLLGDPCYIVIVPGHTSIAVEADLGNESYFLHVETTMLAGNANFLQALEIGKENKKNNSLNIEILMRIELL